MMKSKKVLSALVLSSVMLIGSSMPVFAQNTDVGGILQGGTENTPVKLDIQKNFEFSEGLEIPAVTFNFKATALTTGAPNATIEAITYTKADDKGQVVGGKHTVSKTAKLTFEGDFPHAGVYEYLVEETKGTETGVAYDNKKYKIEVHVANKATADGGTYVKAIVSKDNNTQEKKPIEFVNTYAKEAALSIEKQVTGELADLTKQFEFKLTLKKSPSSTTTNFTGKIVRKNGSQESIEFTDNVAKTIKLAHGDKLQFDTLPVGTRYVATEVGVQGDGYTPKVTVTENGVQGQVQQGNEKDDLNSSKDTNLVGEKDNKVIFINDYHEVSITGIIENNLPFILMISLSGIGLGGLAVAKKYKLAK